jgi:hypothetical protein
LKDLVGIFAFARDGGYFGAHLAYPLAYAHQITRIAAQREGRDIAVFLWQAIQGRLRELHRGRLKPVDDRRVHVGPRRKGRVDAFIIFVFIHADHAQTFEQLQRFLGL